MKRVLLPIVTLLLLLMMVVPPFVSATPITTPTTTEEESPTQEETEKSAQEQPAETGEALVPATGETTDSTASANEEENKQVDDINPCLLDPSDPVCPKPDPVTQECPEGYAQNEDGNCFLLHPNGCPQGYHGHEDDETGRCIPNSTPCDPLYILVTGEDGQRKNCERKEFYCQSHENDNRCGSKDNGHNNGNRGNHNSKHVDIKVIEQENEKNSDSLDNIQKTIIAISYDQGKGINCVVDDDNDGKCETFDVTKDSGKEPLLQIIDFD